MEDHIKSILKNITDTKAISQLEAYYNSLNLTINDKTNYFDYCKYEDIKELFRKYAYKAVWYHPNNDFLLQSASHKPFKAIPHPTLIVYSIDKNLNIIFTTIESIERKIVLKHLSPLLKLLRDIDNRVYDDKPYKDVEIAKINIYRTIRKCMIIENRLEFDIFKNQIRIIATK
jgi:hypothetical protein